MEKFKTPFPESDLEWRLQSCGERNGKIWGRALAYITSRAVQDRLDEVCGPDGWQTTIRREGDAYLCTLSIRVTHEDGTTEFISRTDGADATDIEPVKGGISGAVKRVAVQFGIGRYLYNLKDGWAVICEDGQYRGKTKEGKEFRWNPPALPSDALPGGTGKPDHTKQDEKNPTPSEKKTEQQPSDELLKVTVILESFINDGALEGKQLQRAQQYINEGNLEGIKRTIAYIREQKETA